MALKPARTSGGTWEIIPGRLYQAPSWLSISWAEKQARVATRGITMVVNAWQEDPELRGMVRQYLHTPFPDGGRVVSGVVALAAGEATREVSRGGVVLTQCRGGRNRSGLLSALVARRVLRVSGAEALDLVRRQRPNALANGAFEAYLMGLSVIEGSGETAARLLAACPAEVGDG